MRHGFRRRTGHTRGILRQASAPPPKVPSDSAAVDLGCEWERVTVGRRTSASSVVVDAVAAAAAAISLLIPHISVWDSCFYGLRLRRRTAPPPPPPPQLTLTYFVIVTLTHSTYTH